MPFIGNQPALSYTSFAKQDFTTSATTSYTLDHPVTNENELALFINFVRQEPTTAYTASGTTLTLTSATSASDDMYCVFLGKAVQTVNPPSGSVGLSQLSATGTKDATTFLRGDNSFSTLPTSGITEADQWRLTANITSNTDPISSNLERVDEASFGYIGSGMSVSSGVWTFPSTGIYQILVTMKGSSNVNGDTFKIETYASLDAGSNYDHVSECALGSKSTTTGAGFTTTVPVIIDVTNTSNVKVKFVASSITSGSQIEGNTDVNYTCFTFTRLGDT